MTPDENEREAQKVYDALGRGSITDTSTIAKALRAAEERGRLKAIDDALALNCCGEPECIAKLEALKTPEGRKE